MEMHNYTLPITLTCGHDVCLKCILKAVPQEEQELTCNKCETP